jgi:4-diphosphocytidyl-2C-methyl-D-erythritol kinase
MLHGGTCMVRGIGESIELIAFEPLQLVLIIPTYSCNTAKVYKAFDALHIHKQQTTMLFLLQQVVLNRG